MFNYASCVDVLLVDVLLVGILLIIYVLTFKTFQLRYDLLLLINFQLVT